MKGGNDSRETRAIRRQASEWLVLLQSGAVAAEDRERFEEWLREAPGHRRAFTELEQTWERLTAMGGRDRACQRAANPDPDVVLKHLDRIGRQRRRPYAAWAAAAAIVAAATLGALLFLPKESQTLYRTDIGERQIVSLPDGSTVDLNTDSELLVEYTDDKRYVALRQGEAFFEVARDQGRPFIVAAGPGVVRAVGTEFTVRLKSSELVAVTVTDGIVEVTQPGLEQPGVSQRSQPSAATLHQGQRAEYDRDATRIETVAPQDLERAHAWRKGLLIFVDESLANVIAEVNRYTETRLILADAELGELRLGGTFRAGRVEALINVLEKAFAIRVSRDDPRVVMLHASAETSPRDTP